MIRIRAEEKGLRFVATWPDDLPAYVTGDEKRLRQILINLLSNAVRYTPRGEVKLSVTMHPQIGRASCRERVEITVVGGAFSSRRRHTRCSRDWSSDVCSSDLHDSDQGRGERPPLRRHLARRPARLCDRRREAAAPDPHQSAQQCGPLHAARRGEAQRDDAPADRKSVV